MEYKKITSIFSPFFRRLRVFLAPALDPLEKRWEVFQGKSPRAAMLVKWGGILIGGGIAFMILMSFLVYIGFFGALPSYPELRNIRNNTASEVYSEDGVLLGKYYIENRSNASFDEIPVDVFNALIATEDARFFEHRGIDLRAWFRVLVKSLLLFDESSGGGSTLSQQLAKNLFPRKDYWLFGTLIGKMKETFVARRLENTYTKEELLHLYLNTVPFGEGIYGIKVASLRFFNKPPQELTIEEGATLVGMLKGNTLYNPVRHPDRSLQRRNTVLNQMVKYQYLNQGLADSLMQIPLNVDYQREGRNKGLATYFREQLRLELEEILKDYTKPNGKHYNLYTDGLKIYTSIDSRMQQYAEEAIEATMPKVQDAFNRSWNKRLPWGSEDGLKTYMKQTGRYKELAKKGKSEEEIAEIFNQPVRMRIFTWEEGEVVKEMSPLDSLKYYLGLINAGFLAVEPQTGMIKAWVGGIDFGYLQYDHVKSSRQVGSTIKPVLYAAALEQGVPPCEYFENSLVSYPEYENWEPHNSDGKYEGVYSMEGALSNSVNTVSVRLLFRAGIDPVRQLARNMGVEGKIPAVPSIALGTLDASLLEMVKVYSTLANRGVRPEFHYLDSITTSDGRLIVEFDRPNPRNFKRALSQDHADMMIHMMQSVVDSGTARRLRYEFGLGGAIAGKTGTTQNQSDGWFIGFNPKLVAGAWVGAESPSIHFRTMSAGQGSSTALPIWGSFFRKVRQDKELRKWQYGDFAPLTDTLAATMSCPPFLEELPVITEFSEEDLMNHPELYSQLQEFEKEELEKIMQEYPRWNDETPEDYLDRIRRISERQDLREERRERRKEFWNKLLFSKKKKDDN
ncbi:MAG: transglycosylase domain-containing protein [Lewinellaceae bacterium]|nr:transglycosylase domain-containing protein [Lewinella sp.]MCB9277978.1 transglycosylase domain-containing protein [Lewinellaceae bacterium]